MTHQLQFDVSINGDDYFRGLARQEMDFHQSLGELIDNAISARHPKAFGDGLDGIAVEVVIEELAGDEYRVIVADHGVGIPKSDLTQEIFNPGGQGSTRGALNEHGFGLKNALALLTSGNSTDFRLLTRSDQDGLGPDTFLSVSGPWGKTMTADLNASREDWREGLSRPKDAPTGTKIDVKVPRRYLRTIYRRGGSFETLMSRLGEHLGVMFRSFIQDGSDLFLSYRAKDGEWSHREVPPIDIPFEGDVEVPWFRGRGESGIPTLHEEGS